MVLICRNYLPTAGVQQGGILFES